MEEAAEPARAAEEAAHHIEIAADQADLTSEEDREQLVEQVLENFGRIDMLVNAAAPPSAAADLLEMTQPLYQEVMDARLTATLFLTQLVANEMVRLVQAGMIETAKIVTVNSIGAYTTSIDHAPQCLARSALAMMTRLFADRLGEYGINVYEVRAGLLSAGALDTDQEDYDELIEQGLTPIRRWGRPDDVARAVAAIADDLLNFSTGEVLNVDGGFHLRRL